MITETGTTENTYETDHTAVAAKKEIEAAAAKSQDKATKDTPQPEMSATTRKQMKAGQEMTMNDGSETTEKKESQDDDIKALIEKRKAMDKRQGANKRHQRQKTKSVSGTTKERNDFNKTKKLGRVQRHQKIASIKSRKKKVLTSHMRN